MRTSRRDPAGCSPHCQPPCTRASSLSPRTVPVPSKVHFVPLPAVPPQRREPQFPLFLRRQRQSAICILTPVYFAPSIHTVTSVQGLLPDDYGFSALPVLSANRRQINLPEITGPTWHSRTQGHWLPRGKSKRLGLVLQAACLPTLLPCSLTSPGAPTVQPQPSVLFPPHLLMLPPLEFCSLCSFTIYSTNIY